MYNTHMDDRPVQLPSKQNGAEKAAMARDSRYREAARVTIVGSVVDLVLGIAKLVAGYFANSQALIADGIHSLSDLVTDALVLFAARKSNQAPDTEHPYGHGRFEAIATVGLAVALILVAIGIAGEAIRHLMEPELLSRPGVWALLVALASIVFKEWIYHYTMRVARRQRSDMLQANAWHSRTDAISSVIVVIGVAGAMIGYNYLDALAAVGVALIIAYVGWSLGWKALKELVDTAIDQRLVENLRTTIMDVGGVRDLHLLRTRHAGGQVLVDVHIIIDACISISEGHHISEVVRSRLLSEYDVVTDVTVHIDPEDDELALLSMNMPMRTELLALINHYLDGLEAADRIQRVTLHYLAGKVRVELLLPFTDASDAETCRRIEARFQNAIRQEPLIDSLDVFWH